MHRMNQHKQSAASTGCISTNQNQTGNGARQHQNMSTPTMEDYPEVDYS
ncbi:MAG: hypothetical protein JW776_02360 [Candidatus Lokiarchaeota archaeon]|nr:hypothetical protein [Candidatus Lokiarchaeota archaeon]